MPARKKKTKTAAIIPAAGLGRRFGASGKTFYKLNGRPALAWTLKAFEDCGLVDCILPVLRSDELAAGARIIKRYSLTKTLPPVAGGKERQDSIYNALVALEGRASIVAVHDGARPLIEGTIIEACIAALKGCSGVIAAVPVKDTIKEQEGAVGGRSVFVKKTLDRSVLWSVQTPQVFRYRDLRAAYDKAYEEGFYATDDAALLERYGGKIKIVMGSYRNIKITTPEDVPLAEAFLEALRGRRG